MVATPAVGSEITYSTDPEALLLPRVTALADDSFILAWESDVFAGNGALVSGDLFARHLNPTGNFTTGNFLQDTNDVDHGTSGDPLTTPLLVQQSDGSVMAVFNHTGNPGDSSEGIGLHEVDSNFTDIASPGVVYNPLFFGHRFENLTSAAATLHGTAVTFETEDSQSNTHTIVRWFNPDMSVNGSDQQLGNPGETGSNQDAKLLSSGTDSATAVYTHFDPVTAQFDIRMQTLTPFGINSSPISLSGTGTNANFADIADLGDGTFIVGWQDSQGIALKHIEFNGINLGTTHISDPEALGGFVPKVVALRDGTFLVAWTAGSGTEPDGSPNEDIFVRHFGFTPQPNGSTTITSLGSLIHLTEPGDQGLFQMSMTTLADSRVLLTYASETGDSTNVDDLVYRIIDPRDPNLTGTAGDDVIVGTPTNSTINGLGGNDKLTGQGENDILNGGDGNDILDGGLGNDTLDGGAGIDTASFGSALHGVSVNLAKGTASGEGSDTLLNIENATGSDFNDSITGGAGNNVIDGGAGVDTVRFDGVAAAVMVNLSTGTATGQGNDTLLNVENVDGSNQNDSITGDGGNNVLNGEGGADTMKGLGDNDTYFVDNPGDKVIEAAGGGNDQVLTSVSYTLAAGQEIERLQTTSTSGTGAINLTGNEFSQAVIGNAGPNFIKGGGGNDTLTGGGGADTFVFNTALNAQTNIDRITDFNVTQDMIALDHRIFTGLAVGPLAASAFFAGAAAHNPSDRIIYNPSTGALSFDSNGSGARGATQFATLSHGLALTAHDFVVT